MREYTAEKFETLLYIMDTGSRLGKYTFLGLLVNDSKD